MIILQFLILVEEASVDKEGLTIKVRMIGENHFCKKL